MATIRQLVSICSRFTPLRISCIMTRNYTSLINRIKDKRNKAHLGGGETRIMGVVMNASSAIITPMPSIAAKIHYTLLVK